MPHRLRSTTGYRYGAVLPALLLAACLLGEPAAAASPTKESDPFARGKESLVRGDSAGAEKAFLQAAEGDPSNPAYRLALADSQSQRISTYTASEGNYRKVLGMVRAGAQQGAASEGTGLAAAAGLGRLLVKTGRSRDAIPILKAACAGADPNRLGAVRSALALAYYEERLYDDALLELRTVTRSDDRNSTAMFNLKTIRTRLEPYQAGKIYARVGNHDGAASQFRKAIQYDPRFIGARLHLGIELLQSGKAEEALVELHRAESISPTYPKMWEIWYAQGEALSALDRNREALAKFRSTAEARPKYAPPHFEMGRILEKENRLAESAAQYALAIEGDPRTEYVRRLQAVLNRLGSAPSTLPPLPPAKGR